MRTARPSRSRLTGGKLRSSKWAALCADGARNVSIFTHRTGRPSIHFSPVAVAHLMGCPPRRWSGKRRRSRRPRTSPMGSSIHLTPRRRRYCMTPGDVSPATADNPSAAQGRRHTRTAHLHPSALPLSGTGTDYDGLHMLRHRKSLGAAAKRSTVTTLLGKFSYTIRGTRLSSSAGRPKYRPPFPKHLYVG